MNCYSFTVFPSAFIREVLLKRLFITSSDAVKLIKAGICVQPLGTTEVKYLSNPDQQTQSASFSPAESLFSGWFLQLLPAQMNLIVRAHLGFSTCATTITPVYETMRTVQGETEYM